MPLTTPSEREAAKGRSAQVSQRVKAYRAKQRRATKDASSEDEDVATAKIRRAQAERMARFREEHELDMAFSGGGGVTNPAFEARFQEMERDGEFRNLKGAGQPLPDRPTTHFNDDPMQAILNGILANANYKPESLEARCSVAAAITAAVAITATAAITAAAAISATAAISAAAVISAR